MSLCFSIRQLVCRCYGKLTGRHGFQNYEWTKNRSQTDFWFSAHTRRPDNDRSQLRVWRSHIITKSFGHLAHAFRETRTNNTHINWLNTKTVLLSKKHFGKYWLQDIQWKWFHCMHDTATASLYSMLKFLSQSNPPTTSLTIMLQFGHDQKGPEFSYQVSPLSSNDSEHIVHAVTRHEAAKFDCPWHAAGKITASQTESNGSLLPGVSSMSPVGWLPGVWDHLQPPRLNIGYKTTYSLPHI